MPVRTVNSKLLKGRAMLKNPLLRRHLPVTRPFKKKVLKKMMKRHRTLFIKPDNGSQGIGIVRLKRKKRRVQVSWGWRHRKVRKKAVGPVLKRILQPNRTYLIQQGIKLVRYKKRYIDLRVYMQKLNSKWLISGIVVKVGAAHRFITNYHQGGRPETIEKVLGSIFKKQSTVKRMVQQIKIICMTAATTLDRNFPGIRQLGIDIAIDKKRKIWIIEANTKPAFELFKGLKNKTMYHRIMKRRQLIYAKYERKTVAPARVIPKPAKSVGRNKAPLRKPSIKSASQSRPMLRVKKPA